MVTSFGSIWNHCDTALTILVFASSMSGAPFSRHVRPRLEPQSEMDTAEDNLQNSQHSAEAAASASPSTDSGLLEWMHSREVREAFHAMPIHGTDEDVRLGGSPAGPPAMPVAAAMTPQQQDGSRAPASRLQPSMDDTDEEMQPTTPEEPDVMLLSRELLCVVPTKTAPPRPIRHLPLGGYRLQPRRGDEEMQHGASARAATIPPSGDRLPCVWVPKPPPRHLLPRCLPHSPQRQPLGANSSAESSPGGTAMAAAKGVAALVAATNAANRALAAEAVAKQQPIHSIFAAAPPARPIFAAGPPANPMFAAAPAAHPIFAAAPAAEADDEDSNAETLQMCDDDDDVVHSSALQSAEADDEA